MVNKTWHPASTNRLMEISDACENSGTICPFLPAAAGREGKSTSHMCVDLLTFPSGWVIEMGLVVGRILLTSASTMKKWSDAPESAIAWLVGTSFSCWRLFAWWMADCLDAVQLLVTTVTSSSSSCGGCTSAWKHCWKLANGWTIFWVAYNERGLIVILFLIKLHLFTAPHLHSCGSCVLCIPFLHIGHPILSNSW